MEGGLVKTQTRFPEDYEASNEDVHSSCEQSQFVSEKDISEIKLVPEFEDISSESEEEREKSQGDADIIEILGEIQTKVDTQLSSESSQEAPSSAINDKTPLEASHSAETVQRRYSSSDDDYESCEEMPLADAEKSSEMEHQQQSLSVNITGDINIPVPRNSAPEDTGHSDADDESEEEEEEKNKGSPSPHIHNEAFPVIADHQMDKIESLKTSHDDQEVGENGILPDDDDDDDDDDWKKDSKLNMDIKVILKPLDTASVTQEDQSDSKEEGSTIYQVSPVKNKATKLRLYRKKITKSKSKPKESDVSTDEDDGNNNVKENCSYVSHQGRRKKLRKKKPKNIENGFQKGRHSRNKGMMDSEAGIHGIVGDNDAYGADPNAEAPGNIDNASNVLESSVHREYLEKSTSFRDIDSKTSSEYYSETDEYEGPPKEDVRDYLSHPCDVSTKTTSRQANLENVESLNVSPSQFSSDSIDGEEDNARISSNVLESSDLNHEDKNKTSEAETSSNAIQSNVTTKRKTVRTAMEQTNYYESSSESSPDKEVKDDLYYGSPLMLSSSDSASKLGNAQQKTSRKRSHRVNTSEDESNRIIPNKMPHHAAASDDYPSRVSGRASQKRDYYESSSNESIDSALDIPKRRERTPSEDSSSYVDSIELNNGCIPVKSVLAAFESDKKLGMEIRVVLDRISLSCLEKERECETNISEPPNRNHPMLTSKKRKRPKALKRKLYLDSDSDSDEFMKIDYNKLYTKLRNDRKLKMEIKVMVNRVCLDSLEEYVKEYNRQMKKRRSLSRYGLRGGDVGVKSYWTSSDDEASKGTLEVHQPERRHSLRSLTKRAKGTPEFSVSGIRLVVSNRVLRGQTV